LILLVSFLSLSIALQFVAAARAISQIRVGRSAFAWGAIAVAMALIGIRHVVTLSSAWRADPATIMFDPVVEGVTLLISATLVVGVWAIGRAFNELRENDVRLCTSEMELKRIIDTSIDGILLADNEGRIVQFSAGAERIFGYAAHEVVGRSIDFLLPERYHAVHDGCMRTFAAGKEEGRLMGSRGQIFGRRKNGVEFPAEASIAKFDVDGRIFFTAILRDVSARQQEQALLYQAQKMETVGQLTGGIAHDFNNLLLVIGGTLEMLQDELSGRPTAQSLISMALMATERGARLNQQLLAFARKQPLVPVVVDINVLIREEAELLRRSLGEHFEVGMVLGGGLWRATVDKGQLQNALLNLAVNARDAMPEGGKVTIETSNAHLDRSYAAQHHDVPAGQYVLIAVSDTGHGMSREVQARAFEPFFTTKGLGQGTGLGLSMIYGFVKQSGGHLKLYSEVEHGTTVKIYLPRAHPDVVAAAGWGPTLDAGTVGSPAGFVGGSETILVVEDDPEVRVYVTGVLRSFGYNVIAVEDGPAVLSALVTVKSLDLLFTDVVLPHGMNGKQVSAAVLERFPDAAVVFTSGYTKNAIVHNGRVDDETWLLSKPYSRQELGKTVRSLLDARRAIR
jgi:PAS domain S-box-containing protein